MIILAIDLGKFNSMVCFYDSETQVNRFQLAKTERRFLKTLLKSDPIDLVVMEACSCSGWVSDLCAELGLRTLVCSTHEEAWRWRNVKRKTDKDDALKLARLAAPPPIVATIDDAQRFESGRQVSAYAGLVPRQYQSGQTDRRGRITKRGSRLLRTLLVECAWCSLKYNKWSRITYERIHGGKRVRRKKAAVALARRILVVAWAMLRDGSDYNVKKLLADA